MTNGQARREKEAPSVGRPGAGDSLGDPLRGASLEVDAPVESELPAAGSGGPAMQFGDEGQWGGR